MTESRRGGVRARGRDRWVAPRLSGFGAITLPALALAAAACGTAADGEAGAPVLVLGAFPAERAALLERATIDGTVESDGHVFRTGTLGGARVVIGMTGIGLLNAAATTRLALDHFDASGVIVSGVAGSPLRIGDVAVPAAWSLADGPTFPAAAEWLEAARAVAARGVPLDRCTAATLDGSQRSLCFAHQPAIVVGGSGRSSDPFGDEPFPCRPDGGDVFGCDAHTPAVASAEVASGGGHEAASDGGTHIAEDMETAAVAREAAAHGLPFIAFRAVSDGAGDPLGLPGFPAQFFAYYALAANNAAAATQAFLEERRRRER